MASFRADLTSVSSSDSWCGRKKVGSLGVPISRLDQMRNAPQQAEESIMTVTIEGNCLLARDSAGAVRTERWLDDARWSRLLALIFNANPDLARVLLLPPEA